MVLRILRGEPLDLLSRELGVELYRLEQWRDAALAGLEEALEARNGDSLQAELDQAMKRLGELTRENELLWARLRVRYGVKVGRRRVLRLMKENHLLSPSRGRRGHANLHQGEITIQAPNVRWGTDGARVFTVADGWGWLFVAVEH